MPRGRAASSPSRAAQPAEHRGLLVAVESAEQAAAAAAAGVLLLPAIYESVFAARDEWPFVASEAASLLVEATHAAVFGPSDEWRLTVLFDDLNEWDRSEMRSPEDRQRSLLEAAEMLRNDV